MDDKAILENLKKIKHELSQVTTDQSWLHVPRAHTILDILIEQLERRIKED